MDQELQRLFGLIGYNAKRMGTLIDGLLNFSKLGKKEMVKSVVNINEMVKHILLDMENSRKGNVKIQAFDLKSAEGDYTLLYQVFVNLISNAVKYSSKKEE